MAAHETVDVLVTIIDQMRARTVWTRDGQLSTSVQYQVRNNRKQFLRVQLPKGASLWTANVGDEGVAPGSDEADALLVPLLRSSVRDGALAAFRVEIAYLQPATTDSRRRGHFHAQLPRTDVPTTYAAWSMFLPNKVRVRKRSVEGAMHRVDDLSNPMPTADFMAVEHDRAAIEAQLAEQVEAQRESGAMSSGSTPVPVALPETGRVMYFERLLSVDEALDVEFDFRRRRSR